MGTASASHSSPPIAPTVNLLDFATARRAFATQNTPRQPSDASLQCLVCCGMVLSSSDSVVVWTVARELLLRVDAKRWRKVSFWCRKAKTLQCAGVTGSRRRRRELFVEQDEELNCWKSELL